MKVEVSFFLLFKHSKHSPPSGSCFQNLPSPDEIWKVTKTNLIALLQSSSPYASDASLSLSLSLLLSSSLSLANSRSPSFAVSLIISLFVSIPGPSLSRSLYYTLPLCVSHPLSHLLSLFLPLSQCSIACLKSSLALLVCYELIYDRQDESKIEKTSPHWKTNLHSVILAAILYVVQISS